MRWRWKECRCGGYKEVGEFYRLRVTISCIPASRCGVMRTPQVRRMPPSRTDELARHWQFGWRGWAVQRLRSKRWPWRRPSQPTRSASETAKLVLYRAEDHQPPAGVRRLQHPYCGWDPASVCVKATCCIRHLARFLAPHLCFRLHIHGESLGNPKVEIRYIVE